MPSTLKKFFLRNKKRTYTETKKYSDVLVSKLDVRIPGTVQLVTSTLTRRRKPWQSARNGKKRKKIKILGCL